MTEPVVSGCVDDVGAGGCSCDPSGGWDCEGCESAMLGYRPRISLVRLSLMLFPVHGTFTPSWSLAGIVLQVFREQDQLMRG